MMAPEGVWMPVKVTVTLPASWAWAEPSGTKVKAAAQALPPGQAREKAGPVVVRADQTHQAQQFSIGAE